MIRPKTGGVYAPLVLAFYKGEGGGFSNRPRASSFSLDHSFFGGNVVEKTIALELKGVSKSFGAILANKNVDLTVYRGEILSILGENGCGKTTLMNMIAGIYFPDA